MEDIQGAIELGPNSGNYERWLEYLDKLNADARGKAIDAVQKVIESKPEYSYAYFRWGAALFNLKKPEEAIEKYKKATELNPEYADAYYNWGVAFQDLKKPEEAIEKYKKVTELNPEYVIAYYGWGNALFNLKKPEEAIEKYKKVTELNPEYVDAYYGWGVALRDLKKPEEAIEKYKKVTELNPEYVIAYYGWGNALFNLKKPEEAIEKYKKVTELNPEYVDAYYGWGAALVELKKPEEAIEKYKKATQLNPDDPDAYNGWGAALVELKKPEEAIEKYKKATQLNLEYVFAYYNWGNALFNLKKPEEAIEKYKKATQLNPDGPDAYNGWGNALAELNKAEEAIEKFDKATQLNPDYVDAYVNWGLALADLKKPDEAIAKYRKAADLKPNGANIYYYWGNALGDQYRYEEGIEKLQEATKLDVDFAYAYNNIAHLLGREGRYSASWTAWVKAGLVYERTKEKAAAEKNGNHFYYYGAMLHEIFGKFDKAEEAYQEGLKFDPNNVDLLTGLVNLHLEKADQEVDQKKPWMLLKAEIDTDRRAKEFAEAARAYKKAEELLQNQLERRQQPVPLIQLGELYLTMKQYPAAAEQLKMARELDPGSATPWADLGVLCTRQDALKDAIEYFDNAVQRDPYDFTIRSNLAASYRKMNLTEKAEAEYKRILDVTRNHVESHIGLGEVYSMIGDSGDADMYDLAISHFSQAIQITKSRTGSKRLTKKELAAAYYSMGYARVKLYESGKITKDDSLLREARSDFWRSFDNDPEHHKAYRAKVKLEKRLSYLSPQRLADRLGPLLIMLLSFTVFFFTQTSFFFHEPAGFLKEPGYYALLSFGALIFMVAGLYLPQILKLSVGGIKLEKSAVEQITTSSTLGISK